MAARTFRKKKQQQSRVFFDVIWEKELERVSHLMQMYPSYINVNIVPRKIRKTTKNQPCELAKKRGT